MDKRHFVYLLTFSVDTRDFITVVKIISFRKFRTYGRYTCSRLIKEDPEGDR